MLFKFFQNTNLVIKQCLEAAGLIAKPAPVPVRIRRDDIGHGAKQATRARRRSYSKYIS